MAFTNTLDPVLFSLGPIVIRWYSLVYIAAFLSAYYLLQHWARRGRLPRLTPELVEEYVVLLVIATIVGARLFHVLLYNPRFYLANPLESLMIWRGGLSFHGGLAGAFLASWWFCKRRGVSFYEIADLLVIPASLALFFGRIANFVNNELVGTVTSVPWCVTFRGFEGCRHPSQLYEAAKNLLVFVVLAGLSARESLRERLPKGFLFWLFFILYGAGRFLTDFWRAPEPGEWTPLNILTGQWLSLLMVLIGALVLLVSWRRRRLPWGVSRAGGGRGRAGRGLREGVAR